MDIDEKLRIASRILSGSKAYAGKDVSTDPTGEPAQATPVAETATSEPSFISQATKGIEQPKSSFLSNATPQPPRETAREREWRRRGEAYMIGNRQDQQLMQLNDAKFNNDRLDYDRTMNRESTREQLAAKEVENKQNQVVSDYRNNMVRRNGLFSSLGPLLAKNENELTDGERQILKYGLDEINKLDTHNKKLKSVGGELGVPDYRFADDLDEVIQSKPISKQMDDSKRASLETYALGFAGNRVDKVKPPIVRQLFKGLNLNDEDLDYLTKIINEQVEVNRDNKQFSDSRYDVNQKRKEQAGVTAGDLETYKEAVRLFNSGDALSMAKFLKNRAVENGGNIAGIDTELLDAISNNSFSKYTAGKYLERSRYELKKIIASLGSQYSKEINAQGLTGIDTSSTVSPNRKWEDL